MTSSSSAFEAGAAGGDFERICEVMQRAAEGDLEGRVTPLPHDASLNRLGTSLNGLLDLTDAYVRESRAALEHVARGVYYRRVMERGLLGSFAQAATVINRATGAMGEKVAGLGALRGRLLEISDNVASSAQELEGSAQSLAGMSEQVSVAVEQQSAATQEISAHVHHVADGARDVSDNISRVTESMGEADTAAQQMFASARDVAGQATLLRTELDAYLGEEA